MCRPIGPIIFEGGAKSSLAKAVFIADNNNILTTIFSSFYMPLSIFSSADIKKSVNGIIYFCKRQDGINISQIKELLRCIFNMRVDEL